MPHKDVEKKRACARAWAARNHEKVLEYRRTHYRKDPAKARAKTAKWIEENRERYLRLKSSSALKKSFGITIDDYEAMLLAQDNKCGICERGPGKMRFAVDHDHTTGAVRGLLCSQCNTLLERFEAVPDWALKATEYLRKRRDP